jgi:hypothetical protein
MTPSLSKEVPPAFERLGPHLHLLVPASYALTWKEKMRVAAIAATVVSTEFTRAALFRMIRLLKYHSQELICINRRQRSWSRIRSDIRR